jgi:hypothetical protein
VTADPGTRAARPGTGISPYKLASVLLQYPTMALFDGLGHLEAAAGSSPRASREPFMAFLAWLRVTPPASTAQLFLWAGLPYLALGIFVVGHIWRWR